MTYQDNGYNPASGYKQRGYFVPSGPSRWDNLVAGWKMDESSNGSGPVPRADVLGIYELTDVNTTPSTTGVVGLAADVATANTEYLSHSSGPDVSGSGGFVLNFWYKKSTQEFRLGKDDGTLRTFAFVSGMFFVWESFSKNASVAGLTFPDTNWHMYTLWWNPSDGKAYWAKDDGAATAGPTTISSVSSDAAVFQIGRWQNSLNSDGAFDEFYVFSGTKDSNWREDMYNGGSGRSYPE
jgi:hypothetical protein